jgi:hypothetical protein
MAGLALILRLRISEARARLDPREQLVTHSEVWNLLLVGAYKDNEVGLAHPLMWTLAAIRLGGSEG